MKALLHKILYRTLPLEGYLRAVSRLFFISYRLGLCLLYTSPSPRDA